MGYGSTSAGWRRLTRGPGLSMEDAVFAAAGNYEQNYCARGTQDMMPFYAWRGDGGFSISTSNLSAGLPPAR